MRTPNHPIRPMAAPAGCGERRFRRHLAPGGGRGARSRARGRAAALRAAGRLRLQPARLRAPSARAIYVASYGATRKRVLFLGMNPGPLRNDADRRALRQCRLRARLARDPGAGRQPAASASEAPGGGLRLPPERGERRACVGGGGGALGSPRALLRPPLRRELLPAALPRGERAQPDARPPARLEQERLFAACDRHLRRIVDALAPEWVVGIGAFAARRASLALGDAGPRIGRITHPSPANPRAARDWAGLVARELAALGLCRAQPR